MEPSEEYELSRLLQEWRAPDAPEQLEERVMSARTAVRWRAQLAIAAAALLVIAAMLSRTPGVTLPPNAASPPPQDAPAGEAPFVPVPYVPPLDSYETGMVFRVKLPVAALIRAGYRAPAADPAALVEADVLVGDDGRVHAVRLVSGLSLEVGGD
jgi:hypothetical protein